MTDADLRGSLLADLRSVRDIVSNLETKPQVIRFAHDQTVNVNNVEKLLERTLKELEALSQLRKGSDVTSALKSQLAELMHNLSAIKGRLPTENTNRGVFAVAIQSCATNIRKLLRPAKETDIPVEAILNVPVGKYEILTQFSAQRFMRTLGVTTCTVIVLSVPQHKLIVLAHLQPTLGLMFEQCLIEIRRMFDRIYPGISEAPILCYLDVHPHHRLFKPSAWFESKEAKVRNFNQVKKIFPKAEEIKPRVGPTYKRGKCSIDVICDRDTGVVMVYNNSFLYAEFPKMRDFR